MSLIFQPLQEEKNSFHPVKLSQPEKFSSVRIHIERVIRLIKNRYTILKGIILNCIVKSVKEEQLSSTLVNCDKTVTVCAALVNLDESIVYKEN